MIDIVKHRYKYFGISLLIIIPGLLALIFWGLPLAIDFTGGNLLEVRFESGSVPNPAEIINCLLRFRAGRYAGTDIWGRWAGDSLEDGRRSYGC